MSTLHLWEHLLWPCSCLLPPCPRLVPAGLCPAFSGRVAPANLPTSRSPSPTPSPTLCRSLGKRVTIGSCSAVLPGAVLEDGCVLGDMSLVMKNDTVPAGSGGFGVVCPAGVVG